MSRGVVVQQCSVRVAAGQLATVSSAASGRQGLAHRKETCNLSKQIVVDTPWEPASRTGPESPLFRHLC